MNGGRVLFPVILVVVAAQAEPRQDCVTCHRAQAVSQPETSMGQALESVAACGILRAHSRLALRVGAYSYQIERQDDRSIYTVTDGKGTITTPIA